MIFDLDDTLCDFTSARTRGLASAFEVVPTERRVEAMCVWRTIEPELFKAFARGDITREDYRERRFGMILLIMGLNPDDVAVGRRLVRTMNERFMYEVNERVEAVPGAVETLTHLTEAGMRCHLMTNGPSDGQRRKLSKLGLLPFMTHIFISEEIAVSKPDPVAFSYAIERIGQPAGRIAMVGDSIRLDVVPAVEVGMLGIHFAPSGSNYKLHIQRLTDVPAALQDSARHRGKPWRSRI